MSESRWRAAARRVIAEAMAGLPADASEDVVKRVLKASYPFGSREHHPYRCWLAEQRAALEARFGKAKEAARPAPVVRVDPARMAVECGWCGGPVCLACSQLRHEVGLRMSTTDWAGWLRWLDLLKADPDDGVTRSAFADWLEEQGWPGEAARVRGGGG